MAYLDEDILYNNVEEKYKSAKSKAREAYSDVLDTICEMPRSDVVPKSEVEMLQGALKAEERHNELTMEMAKKALSNAKADVAKIFEEIEEQIDRGLAVITKILNAKGGRANGKTVLLSKYDVFIESKKYIAELKKKYIPRECPECKHFVGCEKANWVKGCEEFTEGDNDRGTGKED